MYARLLGRMSSLADRIASGYRPAILTIALLAAVALSSVFVLIKTLDLSPILRSSWRLQSTFFFTFPLAVAEYYRSPDAAACYERAEVVRNLVLTGVSYASYNILISAALAFASVTHVAIFATSSPVLMLLYRAAVGHRVTRRQASGTFLAFVGGAISTVLERGGGGHGGGGGADAGGAGAVLGVCLALLGAIVHIAYYSYATRVRQHAPLYLYLCPMALVGATFAGAVSVLAEGTTLSTSGANGLIGWVAPERLLTVLSIGFFPGLLGLSAMSFALRFLTSFEAIIIVNLEPLFGTILGVMLGQPMPGPMVGVGGAILFAGASMVVESSDPHDAGVESDMATPRPRGRGSLHAMALQKSAVLSAVRDRSPLPGGGAASAAFASDYEDDDGGDVSETDAAGPRPTLVVRAGRGRPLSPVRPAVELRPLPVLPGGESALAALPPTLEPPRRPEVAVATAADVVVVVGQVPDVVGGGGAGHVDDGDGDLV